MAGVGTSVPFFGWGNIQISIPDLHLAELIPRLIHFVLSVFQMFKLALMDFLVHVGRPERDRI